MLTIRPEVTEVMLASRRTTTWRVTALGGAIAGILMSLSIAIVALDFWTKHQASEALIRESDIRAGYEGRLKAMDRLLDNLKYEAASLRTGSPLLFLAETSVDRSGRLELMIENLKEAKTGKYKAQVSLIIDEVSAQAIETRNLKRILSAASFSNGNLCGIDASTDDAPALWSSGGVSFRSKGWRGLRD